MVGQLAAMVNWPPHFVDNWPPSFILYYIYILNLSGGREKEIMLLVLLYHRLDTDKSLNS